MTRELTSCFTMEVVHAAPWMHQAASQQLLPPPPPSSAFPSPPSTCSVPRSLLTPFCPFPSAVTSNPSLAATRLTHGPQPRGVKCGAGPLCLPVSLRAAPPYLPCCCKGRDLTGLWGQHHSSTHTVCCSSSLLLMVLGGNTAISVGVRICLDERSLHGCTPGATTTHGARQVRITVSKNLLTSRGKLRIPWLLTPPLGLMPARQRPRASCCSAHKAVLTWVSRCCSRCHTRSHHTDFPGVHSFWSTATCTDGLNAAQQPRQRTQGLLPSPGLLLA